MSLVASLQQAPLAAPSLPRDPDTVYALVALVVVVVLLGIALVRAALRRRERRTRLTRAQAELGLRPVYCFCGQPAERAASRTGEPTWLDDIFPAWRRVSLEAQYKPAIPADGIPTLCSIHGRTWDALLERKVIEVVALERAKLHLQIADAMAKYEGGDLAAELELTLSDNQKKARKKLEGQRTKPDGVEKVVVVSPAAFQPGGIGPDSALDGVPPGMIAAASAPPTSQSPVPPPQAQPTTMRPTSGQENVS